MDSSIELLSDIEIIQRDWLKLQPQANISFFLSWSWIGTIIELLINEVDIYVFRLIDADEIVAICFVTYNNASRIRGLIHTNQVHINESLKHDHDMVTQYNGILCKTGYEQSAWNHLIVKLDEHPERWDEIYVSSLTAAQLKCAKKAMNDMMCSIDKVHSTWNVPLAANLEDFVGLISQFKQKSRQQLRQSLKAYREKYGEITVTNADTVKDALVYFDEMKLLHTKRWQKVGEKGSFANQKWVEFHRLIISAGFQNNNILMLKIRSGDEIIGYVYGCIYDNTAYMIQTGFSDSPGNKFRPGYISHAYAMLYCAKKQCVLNYDFLPDWEDSYKKFFVNSNDKVYWARLQKKKIIFYFERMVERFSGKIKKLLNISDK